MTVRAHFDAAGIRHVQSVLTGVPGAVPWRMTSADYHESVPSRSSNEQISITPWDPSLSAAMAEAGKVAFEETLIPQLLADVRAGRPIIELSLGFEGKGSPDNNRGSCWSCFPP